MDLNIIRCWNYIRQGSVRKDEEHLNWRICDLMEGSYFDKECKLWILVMKANEMHYFSNLFDKVLYMFRASPDDGQWNFP